MTEQLLCDLDCGRNAVIKVGKLNLCDHCVDKVPEVDIPGPRLRFEDVIVPDVLPAIRALMETGTKREAAYCIRIAELEFDRTHYSGKTPGPMLRERCGRNETAEALYKAQGVPKGRTGCLKPARRKSRALGHEGSVLGISTPQDSG